jgi:hypothetical protein
LGGWPGEISAVLFARETGGHGFACALSSPVRLAFSKQSFISHMRQCRNARRRFLGNVRSEAALIGSNIRPQGEFRDLVRTGVLWAK